MGKNMIVFIFLIILLGCSNSNLTLGPNINDMAEAIKAQDNHWGWGIWEFRFSEDHSQIEVIPIRGGQYHYCVTKLMEEFPCSSCLAIGKPMVQADGTVKLKVTLRHPFPNSPKYTGFDVRGMVYFPPTAIYPTASGDLMYGTSSNFPDGPGLVLPKPYSSQLPLIFSRVEQGGGELLNADGYSCYLIPGATYSKKWPIYSYSPPKYGNEPTPFTTINPYKLFASDIERRMFLVTDKITREYHFALPPGAFNFGYAVDASWWPPTKTPVTNPAVDFPREANAEDPWLIEYEQLLPICIENVGKDIFKVTVHHRGDEVWNDALIWAWDLSGTCPPYPYGDMAFPFDVADTVDDFTNEGYCQLYSPWWKYCGAGVISGHHLGVLTIRGGDDANKNTELDSVWGVRFVDIYIN
jgi:hypothetical protein